jgi:hypothetical protein
MSDPSAFLRREKATLTWLRDKAVGMGNLHPLYLSAGQALLRLKDTIGMSVLLKWKVRHDMGGGEVLWLYVGGRVDLAGDRMTNASYFLCVARDAAEGRARYVYRKYHFDYADPAGKRRRPHPVFHLQYPGTLPSELRSELDDRHMDGRFEEPRVFCGPMSLALVLHMAFREFPDRDTESLRKDGYWLSMILGRDQKCIWHPFYEKCVSLMVSNKIVLDEAYGA